MRWVAERCGRRGVLLVCGMMAVVGICLGRLSASDRKSGFTEHLLAGNLGYVFGVAAADLDGDGDLDITSPDIQDKSVSTLYLFRNNGKGKFQKQVIFAGEPGWFERHVIGDINGDGTPDVAIVNNQKGNVVWFANPGKNGKLPWQRFLITSNCPKAYDVALADLDGDGDLDAATSGYRSHLVSWYENPGRKGLGREWTRRVVDSNMHESRTLCVADFDRDGDPDLLSTAVGTMPEGKPDSLDHQSRVVWYQNPGKPASGTWVRHVIEDRLPAAIHGRPVDLDADGDLDVVMAHGMRVECDPKISRHQVAWYENTSTGKGIPRWKRHLVGRLRFAFEANTGDIDSDGDIDIVATAWSKGDRVVWFENAGGGQWKQHVVRTDFRAANQVILADLDGDKRLDIVAGADDGSRRVQGSLEVRWWRNGLVKKK